MAEGENAVSVYSHFAECPEPGNLSVVQRTIRATGISRRTLFRVRKELRETGTLTSPKRCKRGSYKPIDGFDELVIRNKVQEFYEHRRQLPTLRNLLAVLKKDIHFPGGRWLLRKTLRRLGFSWKKTMDNRKVLIEKESIVRQRLAFYGKKTDLENRGFNFVYVDETWIDSAYTTKRCWQREDAYGLLSPCNRGQRLIVVHAGSRSRFVNGAQLVYKAMSATGDYHHEMNGQNFKKWVQERLLPNLDMPCAIVMDNASYHSIQTDKCPTSSTRKADIKEWLRKHQIAFDEGMLKSGLLDLARLHKPEPAYVIDQIIRSHGHEVLRLPPYHPEFNAIELIWAQLKSIVRHRNVTFRLDDIFHLASAAFGEIGKDRWRNACYHVDKMVEKMKKHDHYLGEMKNRFVIHITDDTTDSNDGSTTETASMGSSTDTASEAE